MNIKSLLALAAAAIVGQASATVAASNTLVRIAVPCSGSAIVAVPVMKIAGTTTAISPTDYILASNLAEGSEMTQWDATNARWNVWKVTSGAWVAQTTLKGTSSDDSPNPSNAVLATGEAVWVTTTSSTIYVYGQVATASRTFAEGSAETPVYTLIGNPNLTPLTLTSSMFSGAKSGDQIVWVGGSDGIGKKMYYHNGTEFVHDVATKDANTEIVTTTEKTLDAESESIDPGVGIWYVSRGGSGTFGAAAE